MRHRIPNRAPAPGHPTQWGQLFRQHCSQHCSPVVTEDSLYLLRVNWNKIPVLTRTFPSLGKTCRQMAASHNSLLQLKSIILVFPLINFYFGWLLLISVSPPLCFEAISFCSWQFSWLPVSTPVLGLKTPFLFKWSDSQSSGCPGVSKAVRIFQRSELLKGLANSFLSATAVHSHTQFNHLTAHSWTTAQTIFCYRIN